MSTETASLFTAQELTRFTEEALVGADVPPQDACTVADALVDAQLRGVASHGMQMLPHYVRSIRQGTLNPKPAIATVMDHGPSATVDGDMGFGHLVATKSIDLAISKALEYGVGTVSVRKCSHTGALAYYANRATDRGCIGLTISQSATTMAPTGGVSKLVGNNPLAYAFPTRRGFPLSLDMALSVVAGARVMLHHANGWPLPDGWVLDAQGRPTNDGSVFSPLAEGGGTLVPVGGYKGYGLAVAHDILTGVLSGGRFGYRLGAPGFSMFLQAVRIDWFLPLDEYYDRIDALIDQLKSSELAPGSTGIFVPGEQAHARKVKHLAEGMPLHSGTLRALDQLAVELGLQPLRPMAL